MILYMQSDYFGQICLPQFSAKTFPFADGGRVYPEDGSLWASGAYITPSQAVPIEGQFIKLLNGVADGLGGYFDWGIINSGNDTWQLCRWVSGEDGAPSTIDATYPMFELDNGTQHIVTLHWGFVCYNDDLSNPAQLAYCISPGNSIEYLWNLESFSYEVYSITPNQAAFDSDAKSSSFGIPLTYSVWSYSASDRGNIYSNSDATTANGGAAGYLPANYTGGDSAANIGNGSYGRFGMSIDFGEGYTSGVLSCGLITMYNPTSGQLSQLARYLTSDNFFDTLKKNWSDPMESIISLAIFPTAPEQSTIEGANLILGGVDTGIQSQKVVGTDTTRVLSFGSVTLSEYFKGKNFLDYNGTRAKIWLPYVGFRELNIKDIMSCDLQLRYRVDFLNGDFIAELKATYHGNIRISRVLISERGNMSIQIPLTSQNYIGAYQGLLNVGAAVIGGNPLQAVSAGVNAVTSEGVQTEHSGSIGGSAAAMGNHRAYILIDRPIPARPATYGNVYGSPLEARQSLTNLKGFTVAEIQNGEIAGIPEEEKSLIIEAFKRGVVL